MKRIAVCDDESSQTELLHGYIADWSRVRREAAEAVVFPSGEAFWFAWEEDKTWDALLLDIQMEGITGVELAKKLRADGSELPIVFITGLRDYMGEGYEVEALHYLLKPVSKEKLFGCLDRAMQRSGREPLLLLEDVDGQALRLLQKDVAAAEAAGHRTRLTLSQGQSVEVKTSFRAVADQLAAGDFVQCHRSYMVGLRHVQRLQKEQVVLDSGLSVPVSRRLFSKVNEAFVRFYRQDGNL